MFFFAMKLVTHHFFPFYNSWGFDHQELRPIAKMIFLEKLFSPGACFLLKKLRHIIMAFFLTPH